jgi:hypothetical protein
MASPDLVKYFHSEKQDDTLVFIETLQKETFYLQKNLLEGLIKKNYLCKTWLQEESILSNLWRGRKIHIECQNQTDIASLWQVESEADSGL